jgi:hypothetical protein
MSVPYKNPISSVQVSTPLSVSRTSVFGTNFSNLNVGGYMEVYNLSDLSLTLTASTYPSLIQLSANTIPIRYTKGNGTFLSPDYLTLNSDNISSGRRRLGMMVYVHETDKVYQYVIPNYDTLWDNLSGLTGFSSVTYSDYTTVINSRSSAGQAFLSGWTSSTIEGVSGFTSSNSNWRIFQTGSGSGGDYLPLSGGSIDGVVSITPTTTDYPLLINSRNFVDGSSGARMFFFTPSGVTYSSINVRSNGGTSSGNLLLQADGNGSVGVNTSTSNPTLNYNLDVRGTFGATSVSATTISLPFTSGSTLFAGTSGQISQNNSQFFWDNVNNRFGIGTNLPQTKLDVIGTTRLSGTTSIVGDISQTSPSFTGTHTIGFFANNAVRFTNSGIGSYMTAGPGNIVDFQGQRLQSVQRGAIFGNTIASTSIVALNAFAAQSSGTISSSGIDLSYPINNTGTYSGITRGFYYNPTLTSLVGTTHRAIETTSGNVVFGSTSGNVLIGKTTDGGFKLDVSGTTRFSGLTQNILTVIGSGNSTTSPIFSVQGSQGELFSVTDSLTGSLFSVNDISGLPILEVFSDNTTLMGSYLAPSLNTTIRVVLTAGTNTIYSIPVSAYTGAFFDYTVASTGTTGVRAGTVTSVWSGSTAEFTDISTNDIGSTTGVTFSVTSNGTLAQIRSSATTSGWIVKSIIRSI